MGVVYGARGWFGLGGGMFNIPPLGGMPLRRRSSVREHLGWFGVVWAGLKWFGVVWGWSGLVSGALGWFGVVWGGLGWFGVLWGGLGWFGVVWGPIGIEKN